MLIYKLRSVFPLCCRDYRNSLLFCSQDPFLTSFRSWSFGGIPSLNQMFPLLFICLGLLHHCVPHWNEPSPSFHLTCPWKSNIHPLECTLGRSWGTLGWDCHLKSSCPLGLWHLVEHRSHLRRECVLLHHPVRVSWVPQVGLPPGVSHCCMRGFSELSTCAIEVKLEEEELSHLGAAEVWGHQDHPGCRRRLWTLSCPLGPPGGLVGGHTTVAISAGGSWRDGDFTL